MSKIDKRKKMSTYNLVKSFPVGVFFTEKDCVLNGKPLDMEKGNFRKRVRQCDPRFEVRFVKGRFGVTPEFRLTKTKKDRLLKMYDGASESGHTSAKSYVMLKDGKEIRITNMSKFCDANNLSRTSMDAVNRGTRKEYKGYSAVKYSVSEPALIMPADEITQKEHDLFLTVMNA